MLEKEIIDRIERLEQATRVWRRVAVSAVATSAVFLVTTIYAFSQQAGNRGNQPKVDPQQAPNQFATELVTPTSTYANFFRVSVTAEELILDYGLNTQTEPGKEPVKLTQRLVTNLFTAKRLAGALQGVVAQHEAVYGPLELDFQKRMKK